MLPLARLGCRFGAAAILLLCTACSDSGAAQKQAGGAAIAVTIETAALSPMQRQIDAAGTVEASATIAVSSLVDGQLKSVLFKEGDHVSAGQALFQIDDTMIRAQIAAAQATMARDQATARQLEAEYQRTKTLAAKGYESASALDLARAAADAAQEAAKSDDAQIGVLNAQLVHYTITAPIDGRTGESLIQPGATVASNGAAALVTINQISPVRVRFAIPSDGVADAWVHMGKGDARVLAVPHGSNDKPSTGALVFLDNAVSDANGQLLAKGEFANADETLLPGALVDVTLDLGTAANLVALPETAVLLGSDKPYVYLATDGDMAQRREVEIAGRIDGKIFLKSGVSVGERVVIDGLTKISDGARLTIKSDDSEPQTSAAGTAASSGSPL